MAAGIATAGLMAAGIATAGISAPRARLLTAQPARLEIGGAFDSRVLESSGSSVDTGPTHGYSKAVGMALTQRPTSGAIGPPTDRFVYWVVDPGAAGAVVVSERGGGLARAGWSRTAP